MKLLIKILAWNILLLMTGVVLVELIFGDWLFEDPFRKLHVYTQIDREYTLDGLYPGVESIRYTRDKYGLRGSYPSPERIGILTVGGSTTDQAYLSDGDTWQDVLAQALADKGYSVPVVNAGIDGHSSRGHLKNFEWWFPRIPDFAPSCIMYYIGINDIFVDSEFDKGWRGIAIEKSVSYRIYSIVRGALLARKYDIGHNRIDFGAVRWTERPLASPSEYEAVFRDRLEAYRDRVRSLVEQTRALGAMPVFITQQMRMFQRDDSRVMGIDEVFNFHGYRFNGVDFYYILELFNDVVRSECSKIGILCIDLAADLILTNGDYYDYMHNTPAGAQKIGRFLADQLADIPDFRDEVLKQPGGGAIDGVVPDN